jgi:hypothetical protein
MICTSHELLLCVVHCHFWFTVGFLFPFLDYIIPQLRQKVNPIFKFLYFAQNLSEQLEVFVQFARRPTLCFNTLM